MRNDTEAQDRGGLGLREVVVVVVIVEGLGSECFVQLRDDAREHPEAHFLLGCGWAIRDDDDNGCRCAVHLGHDHDRALPTVIDGQVIGGKDERITLGLRAELLC
jgi:hypothetical protein